MKQLPLSIRLCEDATFDTFCAGANEVLVAALRSLVVGPATAPVYLWGPAGVGRSHLLQACCHALSLSLPAVYLPLSDHSSRVPEVLEDLEQQALVALDDVDQVMGQPVWEEALFHFYNRAIACQTRLVFASSLPPQHFSGCLPDLQSRLMACVVFRVLPLRDEEKLKALQMRAKQRGFTLPEEVGHYLLHHYTRDMPALFALLSDLDHESLAEQRKLTVPFVKKVILLRGTKMGLATKF